VLGLELVLAWGYRNAFRPMLRLRVEPESGSARVGQRVGEPVLTHTAA
jgi:hypothetical protein